MLGNYDLMAFVATGDAAKAKAFYQDKLGLEFVSQDDFAVVFNAHGILIRITPIPGHKPTEHTVLGWRVPNIAAAAADLEKAGVKFGRYSFLEQDSLGIWTAPGGAAKVAWFKDPDGNVLSVSQH